MGIKDSMLMEFQHEMKLTRKMLERVPDDKFSWKPHEKSMSLGQLATHVAESAMWMQHCVSHPVFRFGEDTYNEQIPDSTAEILKRFDGLVKEGVSALESTTDEKLNTENWKLTANDTVYVDEPRSTAARNMCLSHIIHHRGQLSVYLRLLNVPLPSIYGPTADENV
jgi:uncharacterized damage-inducible protein DinB